MGKRGYPPNFVKPKIKLEVFRLYDTFAYNAAVLALCIEDGTITEDEAINYQTILFSKEAERLSKHQELIAKVKRGAKPKTDTILRLATIEKWASKGLGFMHIEPYLVLSEAGNEEEAPVGLHELKRVKPDTMRNRTRDRDKHALEIVIGTFMSRRLNYWNRRLRSEL